MTTVAEVIVRRLLEAGVRMLVGMPGGGSNLDIIEAAGRVGLPFVLTHTETAGALLACAQAELTGKPAVCIATLGPGVASVVNGSAHASLDRVPLLLLSDAMASTGRGTFEHQWFDHGALFAPVTKGSISIEAARADEQITDALRLATTPAAGPVHIDLAPDVARQSAKFDDRRPTNAATESLWADWKAFREVIANTRRPIIIAGLGVRDAADTTALRELCEMHNIPALVTYKAKGVIPDQHPLFGGVFTLGALERPIVERADLIIGVGLDPVEFLPRKWDFHAPVVMVNRWRLEQHHVPVAQSLTGNLPELLHGIDQALSQRDASRIEWQADGIRQFASKQRAAMRIASDGGWSPSQAVDAAARAVTPDTQITVDAGAHMFPIMALWPARRHRQILISNGLSTMGFALPSAIGAALLDRTQRVVALTGDGGLLMCLAELGTASREKLKVTTIVFNDRSLSLIRIKQEAQRYPAVGMSLDGVDWQHAAKTFGVPAWRVHNDDEMIRAIAESDATDGPALIEAVVDPASYPETMRVLRG